MKRLMLISLVVVLALALGACTFAIGRNVSARGTVQLIDLGLPTPPFATGEATFSLNFACYAQNNNRVEGNLTWNDPANGVRISATLPETPVSKVTDGLFTTCRQMRDAVSAFVPFPVIALTTGIYSENGNADGNLGRYVGQVAMIVAEPGEALPYVYDTLPPIPAACADLRLVAIAEWLGKEPSLYEPDYLAVGCLDQGKITWGSGQNQQ